MKKEIVYTDKYALILSDEIPTKVYYDTYIHQLKHTGGAEYGESSIAKTVIGHLPLTDDAPILEGVPLLPPLPKEDDVEELAKEEYPIGDDWDDIESLIRKLAFKKGYNKAKEKYKYTEEDVVHLLHKTAAKYFQEGRVYKGHMAIAGDPLHGVRRELIKMVQSLQQPSRPNHFECEIEVDCNGNNNNGCFMDSSGHNCGCVLPKTITNSQGHIELVGKYLNL
jgi:hypothetical protein